MLSSSSQTLTPWLWLWNGDSDGDTTDVAVRWSERLELRLLAVLEGSHLSTIPRTWPFAFTRMETALAPDVVARLGKLMMDRKVYECSRSSEPFSSGSGLGCRSAPYIPAKHVLPKVTCSDE